MRLAAMLLAIPLSSCAIINPFYDAAAAATKPLTVASVTWLAGALVNPVVAALTAGTVLTVWDVAETKEQVEDEKQENIEDKERQDEMTRDIIAAMIDGKTDNLTNKYDTVVADLWLWFKVCGFGWLAFYALRHVKDIRNFLRRLGIIKAPKVTDS